MNTFPWYPASLPLYASSHAAAFTVRNYVRSKKALGLVGKEGCYVFVCALMCSAGASGGGGGGACYAVIVVEEERSVE